MNFGLKHILKRIIPPPINIFNREIKSIKNLLLKQKDSILNTVVAHSSDCKEEISQKYQSLSELFIKQNEGIKRETNEQYRRLEERFIEQNTILLKQQEIQMNQFQMLFEKYDQLKAELVKALEHQELLQRDTFDTRINEVKVKEEEILNSAEECGKKVLNVIEEIKLKTIEGQRFASEAVWAQIFKDTILDSKWLVNKTFSPGRWAAGYPYLYALYRVLNEAKPKRILELGLGQTTRMIAQYASAYPDIKYFVVENDPSWIKFFKNAYEKLDNTEIVQLDLEMIQFKGVDNVRTYKGFAERFENQQFDLICIDAPWAGDMLHYGRIDILSILPFCLSDNFVIVVDDYDRKTEQRTVIEIIKCLENNEIPYKKGLYRGKRDTALLCAKDQGFLASM
ncbi:MAG: hypothetical protein IKJ26_07685 [Clostridia bacterium]|nr:hypothetical protein [Clostridia bacterium]